MHEDWAGVFVRQGSDGPNMVHVGVGDEDLGDRQPGLLHGEHDAYRIVTWIYQSSYTRLLITDYVAVLLKPANDDPLHDHCATPRSLTLARRNSTSRRAGVPEAPLGV